MPVTSIVDPALTIKNLLATGWLPANTRSVTPAFSTGWFAEDKVGQAQLTVTDPEDGVLFRAMGTTGASEFRDGLVNASCWVPERILVLGSEVDSGGAKKLADLMRTEVYRIITTNQNYYTAGLGFLGVGRARLLVEADRKPVIYRWLVPITFDWWKTP